MKRNWFSSGILPGVLALCVLVMLTLHTGSVYPCKIRAERGVLDISCWNFETNGSVRLDGTWELYWNKLLTPADFSSGNAPQPDGYIRVPSDWVSGTSVKTTPFGTATYRLSVLLPEGDALLGLKMTSIRLSNRIFINGQEVGASGSPALDAPSYIANNTPYLTAFTPKNAKAEILIQVSDFDYKKGGIVQSVVIGERADLFGQMMLDNLYSMALSSFLLITGCYFVTLYISQRRNRSVLLFGIYTLLIAAFSLIFGNKVLLQAFPSLPFLLLLRVQNTLIQLSSMTAALLVHEMTGRRLPKWFLRIAIGVALGYACAYWLTPFAMITQYECLALASGLILYMFCCAYLLRAILRNECGVLGRSGTIKLLIATIFVMIFFLDGISYVSNTSHNNAVGLTAFLFFILYLASILSEQYANATKTIEQMNVRLLELDKLKDAFLANTSHELRTPLNGIINLTQSTLSNADSLSLQQRQDLQMVVEAGRHLENILNDILDLSSLKAGSMPLNCTPVDVKGVVSAVMRIEEALAKEKGIDCRNCIPDNLPPALADEKRIWQIYGNLLHNSLKFTESGYVEAGGRLVGEYLELYVQDTGCGISEKEQKKIFQPFYHAPGSTNPLGVGLGLTITKQLIELHNGTVHLQSIQGKGTLFTFTLPVCKDTEGTDKCILSNFSYQTKRSLLSAGVSVPGPDHSPRKDMYKFRILVADDDPVSLQALIRTLHRPEYEIVAVLDGQDVVDAISLQPTGFDIVILDIAMRRLSGYDALTYIRTRLGPAELPVLLLTACAGREDIKLGFEAGANDYIAKPFKPEELMARVQTLLQLKVSVAAMLSSEMAFLRAQIKPHFLYNALGTIATLTTRDPVQAKYLLLELSDFLRGSFRFDGDGKGLISLFEELETVRAYLAIEYARFKDRLRMEYRLRARSCACVPVLSIQPLVENAVRHGILNKLEGGCVRIETEEIEDKIRITVKDDGEGMPQDVAAALLTSNGSGIGLKNIHKRLMSLYGEPLHIESEPGNGTTVWFSIPLDTRKEGNP